MSRSYVVKIHGCHSSMQCVRYQSHRTLFSQLRENRTKIAAMGSGCTLATEPAAEISHFWNIPQVQQSFCMRCYLVYVITTMLGTS